MNVFFLSGDDIDPEDLVTLEMIPNDESGGGASAKRKDSLVRTIKVRDIIEAADNEDLVSSACYDDPVVSSSRFLSRRIGPCIFMESHELEALRENSIGNLFRMKIRFKTTFRNESGGILLNI